MSEQNIITRNNYLYHLSQLEYGGSEWHKAMDSLLVEAGRLEGKHEENERRFREAVYGQAKSVEHNTPEAESRV